jgi:hypothetical protein
MLQHFQGCQLPGILLHVPRLCVDQRTRIVLEALRLRPYRGKDLPRHTSGTHLPHSLCPYLLVGGLHLSEQARNLLDAGRVGALLLDAGQFSLSIQAR